MKKLFKIVFVLGFLFVAALACLVFYINSGSFLQRHVLPLASDALQQPVTASSIEFSMFKVVELNDFQVGPADDPLLTAKTIRLRYDALGLLSGKLHVREVTVESAVANLSDEKLNELIGESSDSPEEDESPSEDGGSSEPMDLDILIENVKITDVTLNYSQGGEAPMQATVSNISVTLPALHNNGDEFVLNIAADAAFTQAEAVNVSAQLALAITGKLAGMEPQAVNVKASLNELVGTANGQELPRAIFSLEVEAKPVDGGFAVVQTVSVRDGDSILAHSRAEGTIATSGAGTFAIEAGMPDARLLNLLGAFAGDYDFGDSKMSYDGELVMSDDGGAVSTGKLLIDALSVASEKAEIPRLDALAISLNHTVGYNCESNVLALTAFDFGVASKSRDVITAKLSEAIELNLDNPEAAAGEASASFPLVIDALDLNLFKPFIPASEAFSLESGEVNAKIDVQVAKGGNAISATGFSQLENLSFSSSGKAFKDFGVRKEFTVTFNDMNALEGSQKVIFTRGSEAFFNTATTSSITVNPLTAKIGTTLSSEGKGLWDTIAELAGDYDFGNSALSGKIEINLANDKATVGSAFDLTKLTVAAPGVPAVRPLDIAVRLSAAHDLKASKTAVESFSVAGKDGEKDFLDLKLQNSISIDSSGDEPKANDFAISATLHPLGLDFVAPFVKDAGVSGLTGSVATALKIDVGGLGKSLTVKGNAKLADVRAKVAGSGELTKAISASTEFDISFADFKTLTVNGLEAAVSAGSSSLASVSVGGKMQVPLGPELTSLTVTVGDPIDADALLALWKVEESAEPTTETPAPEGEAPESEFPDMWVEAAVSVKEVRYREIVAKDIQTQVVIKEKKATLNNTSLKLNDGSITVAGAADLSDMKALAFSGNADIQNIQFSPVIKSLAPDSPFVIGGGIKSFKTDFKGTGTTWDDLCKSLLANADFALDSLTLQQSTDSKMTQAVALLLTTVGLNWEDMTFADGHGKFAAKDGALNIEALEVTAHELRLNTTGNLAMSNWEPDLKFGIAVADGLLRRLEKKHIPLRPIAGEDRFKSAPDFKVYGPMDPTELTKTVVWEYTKSFAQNALINKISEQSPEAAAIFGGLTKALGNRSKADGKDGKKPSGGGLGGLIGAGLNALGGQEPKEAAKPPAASKDGNAPASATPPKEEPPANDAASLIGAGLKIFGAVQQQKEREKPEEEKLQEKPAAPAEKAPAPSVNDVLKLFR
jgi:hypothetical protein